MTLASWNDSEYATTTLSTSVFNTESSLNGGSTYADNAAPPGPSVTFSGAVFAPGDVQYWNILTRTKAKSIPGTLTVPAPALGGANTATLSQYFVYRVVNTTAACNAAAFTTSPVWVVGNPTTKRPLTAGQEAGVTISLPAATATLPSAVTGLCFEMTLLDTALFAHGRSIFDPGIQAASLDHSMWFHEDFRADEWLLYAMDSPWAGHGRGMNRGSIFTRDGRLVASAAQEGLIRVRP